MLRRSYILSALVAVTLIAANGCQCCSSCHDYDPPVANCHCGQCGCNGGCSSCGCNAGPSSCGCNSGCSSCNGGAMMQPTDSGDATPTEGQIMPQSNMQPTLRQSNGSR